MKHYRIPQLAQKYMDYPMIQAHTKLPELSHFRLRLLYEALQSHSNRSSRSELYALATALVQLGMDTHDRIDTKLSKRTEQEMRTRQIRVLTGDYFSARFYQLLAEEGQIDRITELSRGVCEVNQLKIDLYLQMKQWRLKAEDYLDKMLAIRSELFQQYGPLLQGAIAEQWPSILARVTYCELLMEEASRASEAASFEHSWAYWHVMGSCSEPEKQQLQSDAAQAWSEELLDKYNVRSVLLIKLRQGADALRAAAAELGLGDALADIDSAIDNAIAGLENTGAAKAFNETR